MGGETMPPEGAAPLVRRLATILCADVAGYSQKMGADEERTVWIFRGHREIFESLVSLHRGRIFNTAGDALLAEFNSAVEAVRCATEIQAALRTRNEHLAPDERMLFRMGINLGDVIVQGEDLLGDGVNVAARIQAATEPGGICISGSVYDQIQNKLSLDFKLLGEQTYKNIAKPVRTYTIAEGAAVTKPAKRASKGIPVAIALVVVLIAGAGYWGYRQLTAQRVEQTRIESQLAAQLTAQKQAAEQAQHAAEDAKRNAQIAAQKQAAEEALRRAQEERNRIDQERRRLESERQAAEVIKKQATDEAKRIAEDARREAQIMSQKQAAEEALRRAQEERNRIEQERRTLESERQAVETAKKQATEQAQRAAEEAKRSAQMQAESGSRGTLDAAAPKGAAHYDGTYSGRICNKVSNKPPNCWPVVLAVRNGIVEASWLNRMKKTATAEGTVAADGTVELKLLSSSPQGNPVGAVLTGRVNGDAISAAGQWRDGTPVSGNWKRTQVSATATAAAAAPKGASHYNGTYNGQFCSSDRDKTQRCWSVALAVRDGVVDATWLNRQKNTATAKGTVAADGTVDMKLATRNPRGKPISAQLTGRIGDDTMSASGQWGDGNPISGNWKRAQ